LIDSNNQLGTFSSSIKFKENINSLLTDVPEKLDLLSNLSPVQFNYKSDATKTLMYGLIAEEVLEQYPELVTYLNGEVETVKYHLLTPLLLGDLQRQRSLIENLRTEIDQLKELFAKSLLK